MKITVRYFAILRAESGKDFEELETNAETPRELYAELQQRYKFSMPVESLAASVDTSITTLDAHLSEGSEVVFLPPVAGG